LSVSKGVRSDAASEPEAMTLPLCSNRCAATVCAIVHEDSASGYRDPPIATPSGIAHVESSPGTHASKPVRSRLATANVPANAPLFIHNYSDKPAHDAVVPIEAGTKRAAEKQSRERHSFRTCRSRERHRNRFQRNFLSAGSKVAAHGNPTDRHLCARRCRPYLSRVYPDARNRRLALRQDGRRYPRAAYDCRRRQHRDRLSPGTLALGRTPRITRRADRIQRSASRFRGLCDAGNPGRPLAMDRGILVRCRVRCRTRCDRHYFVPSLQALQLFASETS
jgi:hypothetical protein